MVATRAWHSQFRTHVKSAFVSSEHSQFHKMHPPQASCIWFRITYTMCILHHTWRWFFFSFFILHYWFHWYFIILFSLGHWYIRQMPQQHPFSFVNFYLMSDSTHVEYDSFVQLARFAVVVVSWAEMLRDHFWLENKKQICGHYYYAQLLLSSLSLFVLPDDERIRHRLFCRQAGHWH